MSQYRCDEGSCTNVMVNFADWQTHLTTSHPNDAAAAQANKTTVTTGGSQSGSGGGGGGSQYTPAADLYIELGITAQSIEEAEPANLGTMGLFRASELKLMLEMVENEFNNGRAFDKAHFLVTLYEKLFTCDAGEESVMLGVFFLRQTNGDLGDVGQSWASFWSKLKRLFGSTAHIEVKPRQVARGLAPKIYETIFVKKSKLNYLRDSPPSWANKYNTKRGWVAACSFFEYMKSVDDWTADELAFYQEHSRSVAKESVDAVRETRKMVLDPSGYYHQRYARQGMTKMIGDAVANGDVDRLVKLKGLIE